MCARIARCHDLVNQARHIVDAGAPEGDPADLPPLPDFVEGWGLGEPDFIVELPEVTVPATGPDYYPDVSFTMDELTEERWIRAIEVRPGNRSVTHHSVIFTGGNPGQLEGRGGAGNGFFNVLAVWSVGTNPHVFPEGVGRWMYPGQRLTVNAHYHPSGEEETDVTRIGLYWGEGEMKKELNAVLAGTTTFEIPARARNHELRASYIIDQDSTVISYFPHMHVRGTDMRMTARYPGGDTEVLIDVPEYDFDWQLFYYPDEEVRLPAGTRLDIVAHYDNSELNPDNPDPNRNVTFGTQQRSRKPSRCQAGGCRQRAGGRVLSPSPRRGALPSVHAALRRYRGCHDAAAISSS